MQTKTNKPNQMKQTKNKTLLEQVQAVPYYKNTIGMKITDPIIAIAWLKGEVMGIQIVKTLWPSKKRASTSTLLYCFLNRSIREAYRQDKIKIVE